MSRTSDFRFAHAPGALPGLGHALRIWRTPLSFLCSLPSQGDLVRLRLGRQPLYVVCHPELADQVLRDPHTYPKGGPGYAQTRTLLGDGLFTCPNAKHKRTRRLLQPPFQRTRVADYIPAMVETADAVTGAWRSGVPCDVMREMTAVAAMIGMRTMFAAEITEHYRDETQACIGEIIGGIHHEVVTSALGVRWLFPHRTRRFHRTLTRYEQIIDEVILAYRRSGEDHADILSMLMTARDDAGEPMSDREVRDNVITMFTAATAAGRASAMVWALHLLDRHPDIARRVRHEIDSVLGAIHRTMRRSDAWNSPGTSSWRHCGCIRTVGSSPAASPHPSNWPGRSCRQVPACSSARTSCTVNRVSSPTPSGSTPTGGQPKPPAPARRTSRSATAPASASENLSRSPRSSSSSPGFSRAGPCTVKPPPRTQWSPASTRCWRLRPW